MDIFKQALAPIPQAAWEEINTRAEAVIRSFLTTRKSLLVNGPFGLDKTSISTGRLNVVKNEKEKDVKIGLYDTLSLMETRISFKLSRWELDNVMRGTKDIDLEPLENATKKLAKFEENTLYNGNKAAGIKGLFAEAKQEFEVGEDSQSILDNIAKATIALKNAFAEKPYNLIVGKDFYIKLNKLHGAKLLREMVEAMIQGNVILSEEIEGGILLPVKHPDIEFTVGQDYTIGYENHDSKDINLFIMNSYTLRVLDPNIIVTFK